MFALNFIANKNTSIIFWCFRWWRSCENCRSCFMCLYCMCIFIFNM